MTPLTRRDLAGSLAVLAMPAVSRAATRVCIGYQKNGPLVIIRQQRRLDATGLKPE